MTNLQNENETHLPESDTLEPEHVPLLEDLITQFTGHLKLSAGASPSAANTAKSYSNAMIVFLKFIQRAYSRKRKIKAPYPVTILDNGVLLAYYNWLNKTVPDRVKIPDVPDSSPTEDTILPNELSEADLKPQEPSEPPPPPRYAHSTIQFYLAAAKRFLAWAIAQNYLTEFDLAKSKIKLTDGKGQSGKAYPHRKIDPNLAKIVLYYDNQSIPDGSEAAAKAAGKSGLEIWHIRQRKVALLRNRAIVHVLFDTALRVSELISLTRDEIDRALKTTPLPEDIAIEVTGKGGRRRTIWITEDSLVHIKAYLEARNDPSNVLFAGKKKGSAITRQMVWKIVKDAAEASGLNNFTGPHAFRHWLARQLFNDEEDPVPIEDVQALLGHASPTTTRTIYAPHTSKGRLHKALKKARKKPEDTLQKTDDKKQEAK